MFNMFFLDDFSALLVSPNEHKAEDSAIREQSKITTSRIINESMTSGTERFLQKEKAQQAKDFLNNETNEFLIREQQKKKEEMLKAVLEQQKQAEIAVNKIHLVKDAERKKLIDDIRECKPMIYFKCDN